MQRLLKGEEYYVTSEEKGEFSADLLVEAFKRAAVKEGFRVSPHKIWGGANIASFTLDEDVPFTTATNLLAQVSQATKLTIFVSAAEDMLGKNVSTYPMEQASTAVRSQAFLMADPGGIGRKI